MGLCKLVLNFDEISDEVIDKLKDINKIINVKTPTVRLDPKINKILIYTLKKMPNLLPLDDFKVNINKLLDVISHLGEIKGLFKVDSNYLNIPAITNNYPITFTYDYDLYLIGVDFSLTGWKKEDTWNLQINDKIAFDKVCTKEVGDRKYFQTPYFVKAGIPIQIILNNNSGNSRQMWTDLQYVIAGADSGHITIICMKRDKTILQQTSHTIITGIKQTIQAPIIDGYTVIGSSSITKIFKDGEKVIFIYDPILVSITIKCIDDKGNLLQQNEQQVDPNIEQTVYAPVIKDYILIGNPSVTKIFKKDDIITFTYKAKYMNITIKCIDDKGNLLQQNEQQILNDLSAEQTIQAPIIDGYIPTGNLSVTKIFSPGEVIIFTYKAKYMNIIIKCIDETGNVLQQINQQILNDPTIEQTVHAPNIKDYIIVGNTSITKTFNNGDIITFTYKLEYVYVLVKCVDELGNILQQINEKIINEEENQTIQAPPINGYEIIGDTSATKIFKNGDIVTFTYKVTLISVVVRCVDESGNLLQQDITIKVIPKIIQTISAPSINGYIVIGDASVMKVFTDEEGIIFTYKIEYINIIVKCVDKKGNILMQYNQQIQKLNVMQSIGDPEIDNYILINRDGSSKIFNDGDIVTFTYKIKYINILVICMNKETNTMIEQFSQQMLNSETEVQTITAPNIPGYEIIGSNSYAGLYYDGDNSTRTIYFDYIKNTINIIVKCVDESGNILQQTNQQLSKLNTPQIVNAPNIDNYIIVGDASVTKVFNDGDIVTFVYEIAHPYRIKVEMQWEKNCDTDVDMYCITEENEVVFFGHKQEQDVWLDTDILEHKTNFTPEILTCNRTEGKIGIGVNIYGVAGDTSKGYLTQDVIFTIKIPVATNGIYKDKIVKIIYVKQLKTYMRDKQLYYVCNIDMNTLYVTEINNGSCFDLEIADN